MSTFPGSIHETSALRRIRQQRKAVACLIVAAACFSLISLCWPLTVTGFESKASVTVDFEDIHFERQEFLNVLAETLRHQLNQNQLNSLIADVRAISDESQSAIQNWEPTTIQQAFAVKYIDSPIPNQMFLEFMIRGSGNEAERTLLELFSQRCCHGLKKGIQANPNRLTAKIQSPRTQAFDQSVAALSTMVSQLELEIESIASELAKQDSHTQFANRLRERVIGSSLENSAHASIRSSPFRQASLAREKSVSETSTTRLRAESGSSFGHLSALRQELQTLKNTRFETGATEPESMAKHWVTQPIGGAPSQTQFVLMGLFSSIVGFVVAQHYNPFQSTRFESVSGLASSLHLPVVATLPSQKIVEIDSSIQSHSDWREVAANRSVWIFKSVLFVLLSVVVGFCLVNEEIRISFLNNPFHGLARMVWIFIGN